MTKENQKKQNMELCELMLSPRNIEMVVRNVKRNGDRADIDGVQIEDLDEYLKKNWARIGNRYARGSTNPAQ